MTDTPAIAFNKVIVEFVKKNEWDDLKNVLKATDYVFIQDDVENFADIAYVAISHCINGPIGVEKDVVYANKQKYRVKTLLPNINTVQWTSLCRRVAKNLPDDPKIDCIMVKKAKDYWPLNNFIGYNTNTNNNNVK
jgi:hypothetical protein